MRNVILPCLLAILVLAGPAAASGPRARNIHADDVVVVTDSGMAWTEAMIDSALSDYPQSIRNAFKKIGLVWHGTKRWMSYEKLAAAAGPVLWFSPDEPLLRGASGLDILQPEAFPFEDPADRPVVYYRIREILLKSADYAEEGEPVQRNVDPERFGTEINLGRVLGIDLDYFFFYPSEEGLGAHQYDVEAVEMKLVVASARAYPELGYWITCQKVTAKAHGVLWYDNNLEVDRYTKFPMHLLVEEGKHASCTDKNGDGHYSPGYDVNLRVNDAWGVRDVMATGSLYTGGYQGWMTKPRPKEYRVFPPLPDDSELRQRYMVDGVYAPGHAVYEVRPFPRLAPALAHDPALERFVDKGDEDWPSVETFNELKKFQRWAETEDFVKSVSVAYRYDGDPGLSVAFPLLVVKSVADPISGGWLVNRIYMKDVKLRDFSWNVLYTTSASRWYDGYATFGWEWDDDGTSTQTHTMTEVGIKMRFNMGSSPLKFLTRMTDFWGVRLGVKNLGIWEWDHIGYALEVGAGVW